MTIIEEYQLVDTIRLYLQSSLSKKWTKHVILWSWGKINLFER